MKGMAAVGKNGENRVVHLQLDEPVELQGVLHGQLAGDGLDEAAHDGGVLRMQRFLLRSLSQHSRQMI